MNKQNVADLARKLLKDGPHKTLPGERRVRLLHAHTYIVDTTEPTFVWEHPYYPQFYVPRSAFNDRDLEWQKQEDISEGATISTLKVKGKGGDDGKSIKDVVSFEKGELKGLVRVVFGSIDQWFEEDVPIFVHPKDPFKRVDLLSSTRPIKVSLNGHVLASTTVAVHLHETSLPVRFYMPQTAIDQSVLRPSQTRSLCPYKGEAEYFNVVLPDGSEHKDLVWYYTRPTLESAAIVGLACFYNEKVDIELDGKKLERPKTHFA